MAVNGLRRRRRCAAARRVWVHPSPVVVVVLLLRPLPAALHELRERPPIDRQAGSAARRLGEGREEVGRGGAHRIAGQVELSEPR